MDGKRTDKDGNTRFFQINFVNNKEFEFVFDL